jgi:hypothetical protein
VAVGAPSRRDFVAMLLGAPAAMALGSACGGGGAHGLPDGELLTPGKAGGHRLRDAAPGGGVRVSDNAWRNVDVAIIGGGIAGLTAAWWLDRAGIRDLAVLELDRVPGGTAQAGASPLTPYPWGAHYVVAPMHHQHAMIALLAEMGALDGIDAAGEPIVAEQLRVREPEERVFYRGRWYEGQYLYAGATADDHAQLARFRAEIDRWVAWRDAAGRRAFALPAAAGSGDAAVTALDRQSFAAWLDERQLTSARLRWLADYACRDDFGLTLADTSAWAGVSYFASRLHHPGADHQPVVTWPDGNGALVTHLASKLGDRLRLEHAVVDVRIPDNLIPDGRVSDGRNPDGRLSDGRIGEPRAMHHGVTPGDIAEGWSSRAMSGISRPVDIIAVTPDGAVGYRARRAIVAIPGFVARRVVKPLRDGARALPAIDRGAWAVANLHLDGRLATRRGDAPLAWDNVLYDSPSLGYVVATHQRGRDVGPTVLTWYYPFTGDAAVARAQLDGASRADWAEAALADLSRAHPDLRGRCHRVDVCYWGHGMPRPRIGTVFDPTLVAARTPLGPLHMAVSELSGVALFEEALDHGIRAADEVRLALSGASP